MKVLFVTAEIAPYSKAGGLADVAGSLPKYLSELGLEVAVFTPFYGCIDEKKFDIEEIENSKLAVNLGTGQYNFTLKKTKMPQTNINIFFTDSKKYFSSFKNVYSPGMDARYEHERYIAFCKAVLEYAKLLNFKPDIVHLNDWHTAMICPYLKTVYKNDDFYKDSKIVFSIHNLAYQGVYYEDILDFARLSKNEVYIPEGVEKFGTVNWVKGAINYSDKIIAVSPRYAEEIQTEEFGCGLDWSLKEHSQKITGILNGLDYSVFNPEIDKNLALNYNFKTIEKKAILKKQLADEFGLNRTKDFPTIGIVSRLVEQKGFELILNCAEKLKELKANFVILGSGDKKYEIDLQHLCGTSPNIRAYIGYKEDTARRIYAGSDMFLMPSHFEPCGLSQLIALKYGTIPIVRAVGGLENTITGYPLDKANGFKFWRYESQDMLQCLNLAIEVYQQKETWHALVKNAMHNDFSWHNSAKKYLEVYSSL